MITIQIRDNCHLHGYVLWPGWLGWFSDAVLHAKQALPNLPVTMQWVLPWGLPWRFVGEGNNTKAVCDSLLPLKLQQYGRATGLLSASCRSLHRLGICGSPRRSLGSIDLPWLCFANRTNKAFWGTVERGMAEFFCWFLTVTLRTGTRKSGWEIWPSKRGTLFVPLGFSWIKPSPESAAQWPPCMNTPTHLHACAWAGSGD